MNWHIRQYLKTEILVTANLKKKTLQNIVFVSLFGVINSTNLSGSYFLCILPDSDNYTDCDDLSSCHGRKANFDTHQYLKNKDDLRSFEFLYSFETSEATVGIAITVYKSTPFIQNLQLEI